MVYLFKLYKMYASIYTGLGFYSWLMCQRKFLWLCMLAINLHLRWMASTNFGSF